MRLRRLLSRSRFDDDVEFVVDEQAGTIHFRSASRAGRGDLGVNRRRMEAIVAEFRLPVGDNSCCRWNFFTASASVLS